MNRAEHPLKLCALKVLENWAMTLVDEIQDLKVDTFDPSLPVFMSWIDLSGVINGSVSIVAQTPFLLTLANNIIGETDGEQPGEEECRDVFREMGNVLAGNFLTEAYGDDVVFDLLNPTVQEIPFSDLERFISRSIVFGFIADDAPVAVTFSIKQE